ncbi:hypothetical protein [Bradyrhizobium monzae]|uniref:hypothetical protein n=1 Tax=Bradyrhizobium sp. Oc8 TaxID=2876780 RepID=UPI001F39D168|nr:hypothetical protein [Bradyrhizobium sp. Oc8]
MATSSTSSTVHSAQAFVASIGVNAHTAYSSSSAYASYGDSSLILDDLHYLGVTTIRDALPTDPNATPVVNALAAAGVKFDFVVSSDLPASSTAGLAQFMASLDSFVAKYPNSIVAIEGLNEANIQAFSYKGSSSMAAAAQFQKDLYTAIKADGHLGGVSVYNLTLGLNDSAAYAKLGDLSKYSDYSTSHAYVATSTPENYGIQYGVDVAASSSPGNPSVITETGYTTLASYSGLGVDQLVQAKSILNSLVDAFKDGVSKTYLYELLDHGSNSDPEGHFGLFNADGTPKLAAAAVHNLTTILSDDGSGGRTPATPLAYTINNLPTSGNSMVLAKSNGAYELVVWAEPQLWNDAKDTEISNPATQAKVHLGSVHKTVTIYDPLNTSKPIAVYTNVQDFTLPVSDHPLIIEIDAPTASATTPAGETAVVATSAAVVADLSDLNAAGTVKSITLTDTHVLTVSSKATMDYMISHYAGVLSTIKGGYSFAVTTSTSTWSLTENYDSTGKLTSTDQTAYQNGVAAYDLVTYADGTTAASNFANGIKTQTTVTHTDGSKDVTVYEITGKSYVTLVTSTNASGGVVEKKYISADGSTVDDHFNSSGALVSETKTNADGSSSSTLYTNSVKAAAFVTNADQSNDNSFYNIKGQSYTSEVLHVNASGAVISVVRSHADGTLDYTETHGSDGKVTSTNFDAKGVKVAQATTHTDGTKDIYALNIQQKPYASEHSHFDASGNLTLFERFHADGSYAEKATMLGGTTVTDNYDSKGALASELVFGADGSTSTSLFVDGVKTKMYILNADHSQDNYAYGVVGQSWVNIVQHADAAGKLMSAARTHADGTLDYTLGTGSDGTTTATYYDAKGVMGSKVVTQTSGVRDVFTFLTTGVQDKNYAASGALQKTDLLKTDGTHVETANAANVTLRGGSGNDTFASAGSTSFVFDRGNDRIQNFHAGTAVDHDVIKISQSLVADYSHMSVSQAGADAVVHLGDAGSILLAHVNAAQLTHANFLFV